MPTSLIEELQHDAVNSTVSAASLLRKALLVATKLGLSDVPAWIKYELSGYHGQEKVPVPGYRVLQGILRVKSARGWLPVEFPDAELQLDVTKQRMGNSIAELAVLSSGDEWQVCGYPPGVQNALQNFFKFPGEFGCFIGRSQISGILDEVRNRVLEWALSLEQLGVKGMGMSFSETEKQMAHGVSLHVENGNVTIQNIGQIGGQANQAAGNNAHLNIHTNDSSHSCAIVPGKGSEEIKLELEKLRIALISKASSAEDYTAIGAIAEAETAAKNGETTRMAKALSTLGSAGNWVLGVAKDIGVPLAISEIKMHTGLPPS